MPNSTKYIDLVSTREANNKEVNILFWININVYIIIIIIIDSEFE